jgi:hypothetical protein
MSRSLCSSSRYLGISMPRDSGPSSARRDLLSRIHKHWVEGTRHQATIGYVFRRDGTGCSFAGGAEWRGNNNAGLVGPARCYQLSGFRLGSEVPGRSSSWRPVSPLTGVRLFYMTKAKFSNSCCSIGMAQPALSTRKAASSAAWGETP